MTEYYFVATEFEAKAKRFYVATKKLMSRQSCLSLCCNRVYLTSQQRILGHKVFHVAIVGQGIASQPGYERATETLCHDSVVLRCIATDKTMRTQQARPGAHDKVGPPRLSAHDKGILLR